MKKSDVPGQVTFRYMLSITTKSGGRPVHEDNKLFEMLILEGMQAGLSWITVLKKRKAFREAFDCFDPFKVSLYDEEKISGTAGK